MTIEYIIYDDFNMSVFETYLIVNTKATSTLNIRNTEDETFKEELEYTNVYIFEGVKMRIETTMISKCMKFITYIYHFIIIVYKNNPKKLNVG